MVYQMQETLWERRQVDGTAPRALRTTRVESQGDRFIPNRGAIDLSVANFASRHKPSKENSQNVALVSPVKEDYKRKLAEQLLAPQQTSVSPSQTRILAFRNRPPPPIPADTMKNLFPNGPNLNAGKRKVYRQIPQACDRILDAPDLVDDYYLNLLDWSSQDTLAVALGSTLYLWEAESGEIKMLTQTQEPEDYITGVSWAADGRHLAVGTNNCEVQIWDVNKLRQVRRMGGHRGRVGSLSWNGSILSSGGRDGQIINHDVRVRDHVTSKFTSHEQEVCGLKWSNSGQHLASGGNDNLLFIWDAAMVNSGSGGSNSSSPSSSFSPVSSPSSNGGRRWLHKMEDHTAAVKALAWCPFQSNLLASGGGTADRCIKFWNTNTGALMNSIDTHSQVCALQWSKHEKEIVSSHGFSQHQLCVWKYPSMARMAELTGHTARVLHMAQSPDGHTIVSAAADETLRFWKILGTNENKLKPGRGKIVEAATFGMKRMSIR